MKITDSFTYKGRFACQLENGLFLISDGTMEMALCKKVKNGYLVIRSGILGGMMMRTMEEFLKCAEMFTPTEDDLKENDKTELPVPITNFGKRLIATLVRVNGESFTYVSRSFTKIDDETIEAIKGCISEDNDETFTPKEIEECYLPAMNTLKEDFAGLPEDRLFDFEHEGTPIWEYNDGVEIITYVLHLSILE